MLYEGEGPAEAGSYMIPPVLGCGQGRVPFHAQWICRESTSLRSESTVVNEDWFPTCAVYGIVSHAA